MNGKALTPLPDALSVFCVTEDQQRLLSLKTPRQFVKNKPGPGGKKLDYVEVGYMRRMLVKYCDAGQLIWSVAVERISDLAMIEATKEVVVRVILSLADSRGNNIVREFFGSKDCAFLRNASGAKKAGGYVSLGNDFKSAEADGLKKCIASLGIAQDVYEPAVQEQVDKNAAARESKEDFDPSQPDAPRDDTTVNNKQVRALLHAIENAKLRKNNIADWTNVQFDKTEFKMLTIKEYEETIAYVTKLVRK